MASVEKKTSFLVRMAAFIVRLYQLTVSPALHAVFGPGSGCRFEPTCSCYARDALFKYGFFSGCALALRRILRCHPWHPGGFDPVPDLKREDSQDIGAPLKTHLDG
ncbi:MAG: membrane protein insertion efficiency factor YidD [Opitutales bacterium]